MGILWFQVLFIVDITEMTTYGNQTWSRRRSDFRSLACYTSVKKINATVFHMLLFSECVCVDIIMSTSLSPSPKDIVL